MGGICNTDLELQRGYYGFRGTPGHEFVGEVVEADDPRWVGRRVVGEINLACGNCEWCRRGLGRHCPHRTVLGIVKHAGVFAEYFTLPIGNLRVVPKAVSNDAAVFTEPMAAACEILDQVKIPRGGEVALLGYGKLGRLIERVLAAHGCQVRVFQARHVQARALPMGGGGDRHRRRALRGHRHDRTARHADSEIHRAWRGAGGRGRVVVNEITMVGSRCGRFAPALTLLRQAKIRTEELISARYPLAEAPAAFAKAAERGTLKVLLEP